MSLPFVEAVGVDDAEQLIAAWRDLAARAAEPNVFAEPEFMLPVLRRIAPPRVMVCLVWQDESRTRLTGLAVLRGMPLGYGFTRVWRGEQAGLAGALWDGERLVEALSAMMLWLRREQPRLAGVIWPVMLARGPVSAGLRSLAARENLRLELSQPRRRAALCVGGAQRFEAELDRKRRKEWARQGRRLSEHGLLATGVVDDEGAVERFLALEGGGWKGERGTALSADPARLAFAREMLRAFRTQGRMWIHELSLDGTPVAMGIVLRSGARAFYWKTTYDEAWAEVSPGVQSTLALSRRLALESGLEWVDSCALQDHPMIDRMWAGRIEIVDFAIALTPEGAGKLGAWLTLAKLAWAVREKLKLVVNKLRGRKRS